MPYTPVMRVHSRDYGRLQSALNSRDEGKLEVALHSLDGGKLQGALHSRDEGKLQGGHSKYSWYAEKSAAFSWNLVKL